MFKASASVAVAFSRMLRRYALPDKSRTTTEIIPYIHMQAAEHSGNGLLLLSRGPILLGQQIPPKTDGLHQCCISVSTEACVHLK